MECAAATTSLDATSVETQRTAGETFESFVVGYFLSLSSAEPRYYFKLSPRGPRTNCRWIWPGTPAGTTPGETVQFLLDASQRRQRCRVQVGSPLSHVLGEPLCRVQELSTITDLATVTPPHPSLPSPGSSRPSRSAPEPLSRSFRILQVRMERKELEKTIFVLDEEKEGFREIVFAEKEGEDLKNLLMRFFESEAPFDFDVAKGNQATGQCEINALRRTI